MTAKQVYIKFQQYAFSKGYKEKVVGDNAYGKFRNPKSQIIKLWGAKNNKLQIYETGVGRYEI